MKRLRPTAKSELVRGWGGVLVTPATSRYALIQLPFLVSSVWLAGPFTLSSVARRERLDVRGQRHVALLCGDVLARDAGREPAGSECESQSRYLTSSVPWSTFVCCLNTTAQVYPEIGYEVAPAWYTIE